MERVAARFKLKPKFAVVIDFAVVADDQMSTAARHRLMSGWRQINNRQAAMPEREPVFDQMSFVVRPTMNQHVGHRLENDRRRRLPVKIQISGDTAHLIVAPSRYDG